MADLGRMRIMVDPDTDAHIWTTALWLADGMGRTIYDACYLELGRAPPGPPCAAGP
jgi:hypothetical protein